MIEKSKILFVLLAFFATVNLFSQSKIEEKARKQFEKFAYVEAIKSYKKLDAKGYKSQEMFQNIGDSYYFIADLQNAVVWYEKLFLYAKKIAPEYYYRYAQCLKSVKNYGKAAEILAKFNKLKSNDNRGKLANSQKDYLLEIEKNSGRYIIENLLINSKFSDYGSTFLGGKVVFSSSRDSSVLFSKKHTWTGENFTNLFEATIDENYDLKNVTKFHKNLNSKFNESTPVFTKDGSTVYFTRNNYLNGIKGKSDQKTTLLKLYKATLIDGNWLSISELPFNSNQYSCAHPAISTDEKTLYFASDMPDTIGQSDLYKVSINEDGTFGNPINLGPTINTEGRETFPSIASNGELYFATDGHPGLGGLDIFVTKPNIGGTYEKVQNIGAPINSSKDDFGFVINLETKQGYFTSNREGGKGGDDIYKFKEIKKIDCDAIIAGIVVDKNTQLPLQNATVTILDSDNKLVREVATNFDGSFNILEVECDFKYILKAEKVDYNKFEIKIVTEANSDKTFIKIELEKVEKQSLTSKIFNEGDDLFKILDLKMIYFDLDKSAITTAAEIQLLKVLEVLQKNPKMEIFIKSHTDCRSKASYNLALSDRRAKATLKWFVKNGIAQSRLKAVGFGETQLINNCGCEPTNKSNCTEEQHRENRRSEFIITKN
jgi:outer membrane protein OmpA-like peptidoglycan-associated protein/tetratricopeptide (TPR) repeat protein